MLYINRCADEPPITLQQRLSRVAARGTGVTGPQGPICLASPAPTVKEYADGAILGAA